MRHKVEIAARTGQQLTIQECPFEREGFQFHHWNTERDGTGTNYMPGQLASFTQSTILYAQWLVLHSVEFDDNIHEVKFDEQPMRSVSFDNNVHEVQFDGTLVIKVQFDDNAEDVAFEDNVDDISFEDNAETAMFEDNTETVAFCHGGNT